jgi:hypothetical protein
MKRFTITALDANGQIVENHTTEKEWCLSELECHFDKLKVQMYNGVIDHILIGKVEE